MQDISYKGQFDIHYAVTVLERQFSGVDKLNLSLCDLLEQLEKDYKNTSKNAVHSKKITTDGGFQTELNNNLFESNNSAIVQLKNQLILPAVNEYLAEVFSEAATHITPYLVGWGNILGQGNWQRPHFHPTHKNLISGCYYLKIPPMQDSSEGHIEFLNPMPISINHGFSNSRKLQPAEGKLLLFPPFYMHYVHPIKSDTKRYVIAFDVLSESPGFKLVF